MRDWKTNLGSFSQAIPGALRLKLDYLDRRSRVRPGLTPSSVLVLVAQSEIAPGNLSVLLTQRTESVDHHRGQFAFPGGRSEVLSSGHIETPAQTALRETQEEIGIDASQLKTLGEMPSLATVTGFEIIPVIAISEQNFEQIPLQIQVSETAAAFWVSFLELTRQGVYRSEAIQFGALSYPIHVFQVGEKRIWGATAAILKNLLDRLESLG